MNKDELQQAIERNSGINERITVRVEDLSSLFDEYKTLEQAVVEAANLLNTARPPEDNFYSWVQSREGWMYRQRVRLSGER